MKWMKLTDPEDGTPLWMNMDRAECIYDVKGGTRVVFGGDHGYTVKDTPEEIIVRGEWLVK